MPATAEVQNFETSSVPSMREDSLSVADAQRLHRLLTRELRARLNSHPDADVIIRGLDKSQLEYVQKYILPGLAPKNFAFKINSDNKAEIVISSSDQVFLRARGYSEFESSPGQGFSQETNQMTSQLVSKIAEEVVVSNPERGWKSKLGGMGKLLTRLGAGSVPVIGSTLAFYQSMNDKRSELCDAQGLGIRNSDFTWGVGVRTTPAMGNQPFTVDVLDLRDRLELINGNRDTSPNKSTYWARQLELRQRGFASDALLDKFIKKYVDSESKLDNDVLARALMRLVSDPHLYAHLYELSIVTPRYVDLFDPKSPHGLNFTKLGELLSQMRDQLKAHPSLMMAIGGSELLQQLNHDFHVNESPDNYADLTPRKLNVLGQEMNLPGVNTKLDTNSIMQAVVSGTALGAGAYGIVGGLTGTVANVALGQAMEAGSRLMLTVSNMQRRIADRIRNQESEKWGDNVQVDVEQITAEHMAIRNEELLRSGVLVGLGALTYGLATVVAGNSYANLLEEGIDKANWLQKWGSGSGVKLLMRGVSALIIASGVGLWSMAHPTQGKSAFQTAYRDMTDVLTGQSLMSAIDTISSVNGVIAFKRWANEIAARAQSELNLESTTLASNVAKGDSAAGVFGIKSGNHDVESVAVQKTGQAQTQIADPKDLNSKSTNQNLPPATNEVWSKPSMDSNAPANEALPPVPEVHEVLGVDRNLVLINQTDLPDQIRGGTFYIETNPIPFPISGSENAILVYGNAAGTTNQEELVPVAIKYGEQIVMLNKAVITDGSTVSEVEINGHRLRILFETGRVQLVGIVSERTNIIESVVINNNLGDIASSPESPQPEMAQFPILPESNFEPGTYSVSGLNRNLVIGNLGFLEDDRSVNMHSGELAHFAQSEIGYLVYTPGSVDEATVAGVRIGNQIISADQLAVDYFDNGRVKEIRAHNGDVLWFNSANGNLPTARLATDLSNVELQNVSASAGLNPEVQPEQIQQPAQPTPQPEVQPETREEPTASDRNGISSSGAIGGEVQDPDAEIETPRGYGGDATNGGVEPTAILGSPEAGLDLAAQPFSVNILGVQRNLIPSFVQVPGFNQVFEDQPNNFNNLGRMEFMAQLREAVGHLLYSVVPAQGTANPEAYEIVGIRVDLGDENLFIPRDRLQIDHFDNVGYVREIRTLDGKVLWFNALYGNLPTAELVVGIDQLRELAVPAMVGAWRDVDGDGHFKGTKFDYIEALIQNIPYYGPDVTTYQPATPEMSAEVALESTLLPSTPAPTETEIPVTSTLVPTNTPEPTLPPTATQVPVTNTPNPTVVSTQEVTETVMPTATATSTQVPVTNTPEPTLPPTVTLVPVTSTDVPTQVPPTNTPTFTPTAVSPTETLEPTTLPSTATQVPVTNTPNPTVVPTQGVTETVMPTATATTTQTPIVTNTSVPTYLPTDIPTEIPTQTETVVPTSTTEVVPTATFTATQEPTFTSTPMPTGTQTATATTTFTQTPIATNTPVATFTPTEDYTPTSTYQPTQSATPTPQATATDNLIEQATQTAVAVTPTSAASSGNLFSNLSGLSEYSIWRGTPWDEYIDVGLNNDRLREFNPANTENVIRMLDAELRSMAGINDVTEFVDKLLQRVIVIPNHEGENAQLASILNNRANIYDSIDYLSNATTLITQNHVDAILVRSGDNLLLIREEIVQAAVYNIMMQMYNKDREIFNNLSINQPVDVINSLEAGYLRAVGEAIQIALIREVVEDDAKSNYHFHLTGLEEQNLNYISYQHGHDAVVHWAENINHLLNADQMRDLGINQDDPTNVVNFINVVLSPTKLSRLNSMLNENTGETDLHAYQFIGMSRGQSGGPDDVELVINDARLQELQNAFQANEINVNNKIPASSVGRGVDAQAIHK